MLNHAWLSGGLKRASNDFFFVYLLRSLDAIAEISRFALKDLAEFATDQLVSLDQNRF